MPETLSIQITKLVLNSQTLDSGNWQYVGAEATAGPDKEAVQLIAMKRDNSACGIGFPASMLTATLMFASQQNSVSDNITIQGIHDLTSNNETGSVSSASARFAEYIGGAFFFDAQKGLLTISPRAW